MILDMLPYSFVVVIPAGGILAGSRYLPPAGITTTKEYGSMSKIIRVEVFQVDLKPHVQRGDAIQSFHTQERRWSACMRMTAQREQATAIRSAPAGRRSWR